MVYDNYEPVSNSLFDNIFGFFLGVRQQGLQTTEEILRDGSFITAVGELELAGNQLRLQPSSVGPMMLSTATKNTILRRLSDAKSSSLYVSALILFENVIKCICFQFQSVCIWHSRSYIDWIHCSETIHTTQTSTGRAGNQRAIGAESKTTSWPRKRSQQCGRRQSKLRGLHNKPERGNNISKVQFKIKITQMCSSR